MVVESIFKLNEMARALSINPSSTIELAQEVQNIERKVDNSYRKVVIKALNEIPNTKDLFSQRLRRRIGEWQTSVRRI